MNNLTRLKNWRLLQGEAFDQDKYIQMIANANRYLEGNTKTNFYFACGHDVGRAKYNDWVMSDLRDIPGCLTYDILLGFPFGHATLNEVKSKLAFGMFTYHQVRFILHEVARTLKPGGLFHATDRDFDKVLARRDSFSWKLFNRYLNGNGLYKGSQRKSVWTSQAIIDECSEYCLKLYDDNGWSGMNFQLVFVRTEGKLREFSPEPSINVDENGDMINDGGDFPGA
jgi:hypothetical protein